jgi:hypothetical protein
MSKYISEILYDVRDASTEEQKIKILQENRSHAFIQLMKYAFLDKYPKLNNIPSYVPDDSPFGMNYKTLNREYRTIPFFYEKMEGLQYKKQQEKLRLMLESLHWTEAALLENILQKNTSSFGFDLNILNKAFIGEFV